MAPEFIEEVKRVINTSLPTASGIISEVIKIIYNKSSNASDLATVIERDPPLTAKILKVANSAYYGAGSTINSLQRAIVVLGFDTIKEITTSVSVVHYLFRTVQKDDIDRPGLWIHSVGTAKAAQFISEKIGKERPEVAYTVGLLHDIGKILLALSFPEHYNRVIMLAAEKKCRIILAERKLLNTDHAMIGKILCDIWSLPEEISSSIFFHHDPMESTPGAQMLARMINMADYMCRMAQIGNPGDQTIYEPSKATWAILGLSNDKIELNYKIIFKKLTDSREEIEGFFHNIDKPEDE